MESQALESPLGVPRDPRLGLFRSRGGWLRGTVRETDPHRPPVPASGAADVGQGVSTLAWACPRPTGASHAATPRDLGAAQMRRRRHREARARAEGRRVSWETRHQTASQPTTFREHTILASRLCGKRGSASIRALDLQKRPCCVAEPDKRHRCGSLWQLRGACPGGWRPRVQGARAAVGTAEGRKSRWPPGRRVSLAENSKLRGRGMEPVLKLKTRTISPRRLRGCLLLH